MTKDCLYQLFLRHGEVQVEFYKRLIHLQLSTLL